MQAWPPDVMEKHGPYFAIATDKKLTAATVSQKNMNSPPDKKQFGSFLDRLFS